MYIWMLGALLKYWKPLVLVLLLGTAYVAIHHSGAKSQAIKDRKALEACTARVAAYADAARAWEDIVKQQEAARVQQAKQSAAAVLQAEHSRAEAQRRLGALHRKYASVMASMHNPVCEVAGTDY